MKVLGIGHVGVCVKNLEKSIEFYSGVMGFQVLEPPCEMVEDPEEGKAFGYDDCLHRICTLQIAPNQLVELVEFARPEPVEEQTPMSSIGKHHISFKVDDIKKWVEKLENAGAKAIYKPISYETEEAESGIAYWVLLQDPDGIVIELMQY